MKIRKNLWKKTAGRILRDAFRNSSPGRRAVMAAVSGALVFFAILVVGFIQVKLRADLIRYQRENGSAVSVYVEEGTEKTAEILKNIPQVRRVGYEKRYGRIVSDNIIISECSVMTEEDWNALTAPAYSEIHGSYPDDPDEILMSRQMLESLGIRAPYVGMKLELEFYWKSIYVSEETGPQEFTLSGYFNDDTGGIQGSFVSYISQKKLARAGIRLFPCRLLIDMDTGVKSGRQMEKAMKKSVSLPEGAYVVAVDSAFYKSLRGIVGGFAAGVFMLVLLGFSVILTIRQMIRLSFLRDRGLYKEMEQLGVSGRQIRSAFCGFCMGEIVKGSAAGGMLGWMAVRFLIPLAVVRRYLDGTGDTERLFSGTSVTCLGIAASAAAIGFVVLFVSFQRWNRERPEACGNIRGKKQHAGLWKKRNGFVIEAAFHSARGSWKSRIAGGVIVSLGGTAALCAFCLTSGTDLAGKLEHQPDVRTGLTYNGYQFLEKRIVDGEEEKKNFGENGFYPGLLEQQLTQLAKETDSELEIRKGFLLAECDAVPPWEEYEEKYPEDSAEETDGRKTEVIREMYRYVDDVPQGIICVVSREEEKRLLQEGRDGRLKKGEAVFVHRGIPFDKKLTDGQRRATFWFYDTALWYYDIPAPDRPEQLKKRTEALNVTEDLDLLQTDLSDLDLIWEKENVCYLLVNDETFRSLSETMQEQVLEVNFFASEEKREECVERVQNYVRRTNQKYRTEYDVEADLIAMVSKEELAAREKTYLDNSRFCMSAVCGILLLSGLGACMGTWYLELAKREHERELLNILGVTGRQIKAVLRLEGAMQGAFVTALTAAAGNGAVRLLDQMVKKQSSYFEAVFSWGIFGVLACVILLIFVLMPECLLRAENRKNKNGAVGK